MNKKVRVITMLTKIETNMKVFAENFKAAKKAFVLNSSMEASACAAAFIGEEQPVTADQLKDAKHLLSKNTGLLSTLGHGNARQVVSAVLAKDPDPDLAMKRIAQIHKALDKKFFNSDYLVLAATIIYQNSKPEEYDQVVARTRQIYKRLRADHPMLTGREDLANCALMALSGYDPGKITETCEQDFQYMKKSYVLKNKVQYLSCITSLFDGAPDEKDAAVDETRKLLKEYGVRFDTNAYSIVGALAMIVDKPDRSLVCGHIAEVSSKLKSIRGMGSLGAGKKIRNMIATAIVIDAYADGGDDKAKNSAISAIISAVIAAEVAAICAAVAASSAAAASSSS